MRGSKPTYPKRVVIKESLQSKPENSSKDKESNLSKEKLIK